MEKIAREGRTTNMKEEETTTIVARQNLPIYPKLCHFLACEVVVSLGLMSSVMIVGGGGVQEGGGDGGGEDEEEDCDGLRLVSLSSGG